MTELSRAKSESGKLKHLPIRWDVFISDEVCVPLPSPASYPFHSWWSPYSRGEGEEEKAGEAEEAGRVEGVEVAVTVATRVRAVAAATGRGLLGMVKRRCLELLCRRARGGGLRFGH